ncbi:MAG TPA: PEGA domain-containing protein, partial [Cyclobacteriaceae bacterium]|nr:PEGA domain-containing protein [Cyclobacteriaceae bacterium]
RNLSFHSSMSAIERETYNSMAGRYELLVKPVKQILSVEAEGMMQKSKEVINPQRGDVLYFKASIVSLHKGLLAINSYPPNAAVFINDIETIHKTPCTIEVNAGMTKVSLQKRYFQAVDTVVNIDAGDARAMTMNLLRAPGSLNDDNDALSYLNGRHAREYFKEPVDPARLEAANALRKYQRQTMILKRKAAMYYTTGVLFVGVGAGYHWIDRTIFDTAHGTSHASIMSTMGDAFYIMGGAAIVGGIITSVKLSHVKKNWNIQPVPEPGGAGVLLTYKFK